MLRLVLVVAMAASLPAIARAKTITVTPSDDFKKIEAAKAGDVVEIAPGTYKFRVHLAGKGTAAKPITIRAKDSKRRPVWDLGGKAVRDWPGSYTSGDRGRGCWQVRGSYYVISGIEFRNCHDVGSSGLRAINSGPLTVRDCRFVNNTNGLTGTSENMLVEHCELVGNGKLTPGGNLTHNLYVFGGKLTVRYSLLHKPREGQNFHVRARDAVLEYNWFGTPASYPGDLMSCEYFCGGKGTAPITQRMTLRGNVIIQTGARNKSQLIALLDDEKAPSADGTGKPAKMELTLVNNTIVGTPGSTSQRLVNMRNDTIATTVRLYNNIIYKVLFLAVAEAPGTKNWTVEGKNNWVSTGTAVANTTAAVIGADPGFNGISTHDYTLNAASSARGKAASVAGPPTREYYKNATDKLRYRLRATAKDIGAFEHGNAARPIGAHDAPPSSPDAGVSTGDSGATPRTDASASMDAQPRDAAVAPDGIDNYTPEGAGDCCSMSGPGPAPTVCALSLLALAARRSRRSL